MLKRKKEREREKGRKKKKKGREKERNEGRKKERKQVRIQILLRPRCLQSFPRHRDRQVGTAESVWESLANRLPGTTVSYPGK